MPIPGFDKTSIDTSVDPCNDFYKFACGKFVANHPIPADQPEVDQFYALYNVNTQSLNGILDKAAAGGAGRSADEQKIGDYYKAAWTTEAIEAKGLAPVEPLLDEIDAMHEQEADAGVDRQAAAHGRRRASSAMGSSRTSRTRASRSRLSIRVGWVCRSGTTTCGRARRTRRCGKQYVEHVAKMLTLAGSTPEQAEKDAKGDHGVRDGAGEGFDAGDGAARSGEDLSPAADCDV